MDFAKQIYTNSLAESFKDISSSSLSSNCWNLNHCLTVWISTVWIFNLKSETAANAKFEGFWTKQSWID